MIYTIYYSDAGVPKTLLVPSIDIYIKVSDGTGAGAPPAVSELSGGFYKFTATPAEPILCRINSNDGAMSNADAYKVVLITPDDDIAGVMALEATLTAMKGAGWTTETLKAIFDGMALEATLTAVKGVGWTTETLKAIKDAIDAHAGGIGSRTATLTTQNGAGTPITDAQVEVWNAGATAIITWGLTNTSGQIQRALDDGSYVIKIRKAGWAFSLGSLVVSGNTSATYVGTSTLPAPPAGPSTCRVYEYLFMPDGVTPMSSQPEDSARIVSLPANYGGQLHTGAVVRGTYTVATGLIYWDVPQGSKTEFTIHDFGIRVTKTIPASATARLMDIA